MATQVTLNSGSVDSAGSLAFKTNGTTTAVTINSSQGVEFNAGAVGTPSITTTGDTNTGIFFPAADTIAFTEGGVEAMRIDSSARVGIGKTPTNKTLELFAATNTGLRIQNSATGTTGGDGLLIEMSGSDALFVNYESANLVFSTAGNERMRIDSSGNLLVGKTATGLASSGFEASATGMTASNSGAEAANFNRNTSDGTVVLFRRSSTSVGTIGVTTTATSYNTSSDYRLKNSIAPMTGALAKVALLKPCTYKWNVDGSDGQGFIAHELAEVESGCVNGEKDAVDSEGNPVYQGVDTSFLVATLTAAIQELKALVDAQSSTITTLTARITALEAT
jgi:hypothetical protein